MNNPVDNNNNNPLSRCKVYSMNNIELIHIAEFAAITDRSIRSTRHLVEDGNAIRKLKAFRDRSRLMIPVVELTGYPLTDKGPTAGLRNIYHYNLVDGKYIKTLCEQCTFGTEMCPERKAADELVVPEGDR